MNWFKKTQIIDDFVSEVDSKYPRASGSVGGLMVDSGAIPNTSSIGSTFNKYNVLNGIREIPMSEFGGPRSVFYASNDFRSSENLSREIQMTKKITPLIIAVDKNGPYILEGAHRYVALHMLNIQSLPALVVVDLDDNNELV
jgi:hypothetical protein